MQIRGTGLESRLLLNVKGNAMSDQDELRESLIFSDFEKDFGVREKQAADVDTGKIFGLAAGERMLLSVILFLTVTVLAAAVLLATNTIMLP